MYFGDWTNWLDMLSIAASLLGIPFRIANLDVQWVFASLGYIFHGLRIFEYAIILRLVIARNKKFYAIKLITNI